MIVEKEGESRIEYLCRVLRTFMERTVAGEQTIEYDGAICDGRCLANDIEAELGTHLR